MKIANLKRLGWSTILLTGLAWPGLAAAQVFNYNSFGDVLAGFRKTGSYAGNYEFVVDLGSVTNFLALPAGTTLTITNFTPTQLNNAFVDTGGFQNLQWSVFSAFPFSSPWVTPVGSFPKTTLWYTLPATSVNTQTAAPARNGTGTQAATRTQITGVGNGAVAISQNLGAASTNNTPFVVREPVTYAAENETLSTFIEDTTVVNGSTLGDFGGGGNPLPYVVENTTPTPFNSPQRDDFYQFVPTGSADPGTGLTTGNAYFIGYFILNSNGSATFTRASPPTAPAISSIFSAATNFFAPFQVAFTDTTTGTITTWVWNFGNGNIITNTTGNAVSNTYTSAGSYTVTLTVNGPAGSSTKVLANFIVASPLPKIANVALSGGKFVLSGTNAPAGVQYRILTATNVALPVASWTPVLTNTFLSNGAFAYTNSTPTNKTAFFRLVSP